MQAFLRLGGSRHLDDSDSDAPLKFRPSSDVQRALHYSSAKTRGDDTDDTASEASAYGGVGGPGAAGAQVRGVWVAWQGDMTLHKRVALWGKKARDS